MKHAGHEAREGESAIGRALSAITLPKQAPPYPEEVDILIVARRELTAIQFDVWMMTVRDGLNSTEIGEILGVSPRTVREHRAKAHIRMRQAAGYLDQAVYGSARFNVTVHDGRESYALPDVTARAAIGRLIRREGPDGEGK